MELSSRKPSWPGKIPCEEGPVHIWKMAQKMPSGKFSPVRGWQWEPRRQMTRIEVCLAHSYHRHRNTAQLRLRRRRQFAKIPFNYYPDHMTRQPANATFLTLGLVIRPVRAPAIAWIPLRPKAFRLG